MYKCTICDDLLLSSEDDTQRNYSTPCGHVFHLSCIQQWIEVKRLQIAQDHYSRNHTVSCPYGCREIRESELLRIFLDLDTDTAQLVDGFKLNPRWRSEYFKEYLKELEKELEDVKKKLEAKDLELQEMSQKLAEAHENHLEFESKSREEFEKELQDMKKKIEAKDTELQELSEQLAEAHENHETELTNWIGMYQRAINEHKDTSLLSSSVIEIPIEGRQATNSDESRNHQRRNRGSDESIEFDESTIIQQIELTEIGLEVGSLVVWPNFGSLAGDDMEHGIVRWIGYINGISYAGVEFEHEIGNFEQRNRYTPNIQFCPGHGRLMRIRELIRGSDAYEPEEEEEIKTRVQYATAFVV